MANLNSGEEIVECLGEIVEGLGEIVEDLGEIVEGLGEIVEGLEELEDLEGVPEQQALHHSRNNPSGRISGYDREREGWNR